VTAGEDMSMNLSAPSHTIALVSPRGDRYRPIHLYAILIALLGAYLPVYRELAASLWREEAYAHGPLILLAVLALTAAHRAALSRLAPTNRPLAGSLILLAGLVMLWLGVMRSLPAWMAASHIPVFAGIIMMLWGKRGLRTLWFPLLYLVFLIPLPPIFIEVMTWQMKEWIALTAVGLLEAFDYPVARSGMIILVGQYQMLIANACSGLHSILSLSALGMLYVYLVARHDRLRAMLLLGGVLPIALAANVLRTLVLLLVTFHTGDAAGRYWHELMGTIMFVVALAMLLLLDRIFVLTLPGRKR
jgi:exosortase